MGLYLTNALHKVTNQDSEGVTLPQLTLNACNVNSALLSISPPDIVSADVSLAISSKALTISFQSITIAM